MLDDRKVFVREYTSGLYGVFSYVLSKLIFSLPISLLTILECWIVIYFVCDLNGPFGSILMVLWSYAIASEWSGYLIGVIAADAKQGSNFKNSKKNASAHIIALQNKYICIETF